MASLESVSYIVILILNTTNITSYAIVYLLFCDDYDFIAQNKQINNRKCIHSTPQQSHHQTSCMESIHDSIGGRNRS